MHPFSFLLRKRFFRNILLMGVFLSVFVVNVFGSALPARAGVWGEAWLTGLMKQLMETITRQIEGALLASLKVAAVTALNSQVAQMISGNSVGSALFVTDWYDFMYTRPAQQVTLYMNDFYTVSTRGKYASANYIGSRDVPDTVASNYPGYLVAQAKQAMPTQTDDLGIGQGSYDLDQYCDKPGEIQDFRCFNAFFKNMNNPFGYTLSATTYAATKMNQAIDIAKTEAQSSGFIGKKDKGKTIAPAATIENMLNDAQNIGNNIIAAAENPGIVDSIVTAMVNRAVAAMIQKGVGKIQANIQKEVQQVDGQVVKALDKINKELGPGAQFLKETSQKSNVVRAYTSPPPSANCTVDQGC